MKKGLDSLEAAGVKNVSLTDFDSLIETARAEGYIKEADVERLKAFRDNPSDAMAMLALAQASERAGDRASALARLDAARALAPIAREILQESAVLLLKQGRNAEAAERLGQLAGVYRDYDHTFPVLARLLISGDRSWQASSAPCCSRWRASR
jgi:predicted Zn-dependent protease